MSESATDRAAHTAHGMSKFVSTTSNVSLNRPAALRRAEAAPHAGRKRRGGPWRTFIPGMVACALILGTVAVTPTSVAAQNCPPIECPPPPPPPVIPPEDGGDEGGGQPRRGPQRRDPGKPGQDGGRHGQDGGRHGRDEGRPDLTDLTAGGAGGPGSPDGAGSNSSVVIETILQQNLPGDPPAPSPLITVVGDPVLDPAALLVPGEESATPLIAPEMTAPIEPPLTHGELTETLPPPISSELETLLPPEFTQTLDAAVACLESQEVDCGESADPSQLTTLLESQFESIYDQNITYIVEALENLVPGVGDYLLDFLPDDIFSLLDEDPSLTPDPVFFNP